MFIACGEVPREQLFNMDRLLHVVVSFEFASLRYLKF